ncbi:glycosyltransferase family 2 protein [Mesorhizobium sp. ASY16-5R]|uniref:glycosyltransferase family 2 protein n=1 Tax=Mesorhizobium sp. ASY16-5R TaxID=3445772 RepID=UPI003F9F34A4
MTLLDWTPADQDHLARAPEPHIPLRTPRASLPAPGALMEFFLTEFDIWRPILSRLRVSSDMVIKLAARAGENRTDFQSELLASNLVTENDLFATVAQEFGVGFIDRIDPERLVMRPEDCALFLRTRSKHLHVKVLERDGRALAVIAPSGMSLSTLKSLLHRQKNLLPLLRMTTPQALRRAVLQRTSQSLAIDARNGLYERMPDYSARIVANAWQGVVLGAVLVILALAFTLATSAVLLAMHIFFSLFFFACIILRFAATRAAPAKPPPGLEATPPGDLPFYSVLVALHREADVVPQLLAALDRLVWPKSKIEIKLVCEADDSQTLGAIAAHGLPHHVEIVEVPPGQPRTKPKALSYAVPLIKGDYVVLYDAEDRPHPLQLLEAWHCFERGGEDLACVQAPLEISNEESGLIPLLFAFEYSALFRGLLPWLSGRRVILPLGGTSNHLRVSALEEVGGWDPYNVTEDADLGLRLVRFGYRTQTISLPTLEDAPETLSIWLPQRTRWFKGWCQTWLVHMRDPVALFRELGLRSFCLAQILYAGLVLSALVHPLLIVAALYLGLQIVVGQSTFGWMVALLVVDTINIVCGYLSFLLLGWYSLRKPERKSFWRVVKFTPVYWMMMSLAAWRSLLHLWRRPHHWEKTPHFRTVRREPA